MQVYMDNAASTRLDDEVLQEMMPFFCESYANPNGACSFSAKARSAVGKARARVAALIGAEEDEIVFSSGGTEADNMAVIGASVYRAEREERRKKVITSAIEHPAVLNSCKELEKRGFEVLYAPCDITGRVDTGFIKKHSDSGTALISIMTANNELGTVQDVSGIAEAAHACGALFHTDAVQAAGHIPVSVKDQTDLLSMSSHKLHGPKGVGALYVKRGVKISNIIFGGGQENGLRSGTLNVPGIVGFGKACEIAARTMIETYEDLIGKREYFTRQILNNIGGAYINGSVNGDGSFMKGDFLPSVLSVSFDGVEGSSLMIELDMRGICCSTGSACSASDTKPSHVLTAAGLPAERIRGSLRLSFSKYTTAEEIDYTVKALKESVEKLRALCK